MDAPAVAQNVFACTVSEFLRRWAGADEEEAERVAALLLARGVNVPKKLAVLQLAQFNLGATVAAGDLATLEEALEKAAEFKQALRPQPAARGCAMVAVEPREDGQWVDGASHRSARACLYCLSCQEMTKLGNCFKCSRKARCRKRVRWLARRRLPVTKRPSPRR